eukprot:UN28225
MVLLPGWLFMHVGYREHKHTCTGEPFHSLLNVEMVKKQASGIEKCQQLISKQRARERHFENDERQNLFKCSRDKRYFQNDTRQKKVQNGKFQITISLQQI